MPFQDDQPVNAPVALPDGFNLNPEQPDSDASTLGAAFRRENPIGSRLNSFQYDDDAPFDPSYRAYDDIQGTVYEGYSDRFVDARNAKQSAMMKAQIDRELEDRNALDAAGVWGVMAEMTAGLLSPSSLLPGGAVVRGVRGGVSIGKTAISVAGAGGFAAALDEVALQSSQQTRSPLESVANISGGVLLGGLLGGAVGSLSRKAHERSSTAAARVPEDIVGLNDHLRSVGAAENTKDFDLRKQWLFDFFDKSQFRVEESLRQYVPDTVARVAAAPLAVLRPIVRSDPILRGILSANDKARQMLPELVETPLQYKVNMEGQTVLDGRVSVERAIETRRNTELAKSLGSTGRWYQNYMNDGEIGSVGRITAPITSIYKHLMNRGEKFTRKEFMEEVGIAAMSGDQHPIPQIAQAAQDIRRDIFEVAKSDAIEVGIFDPDLQLKHAESYFMRSYNVEKIQQHMGDGTENDMSVVLRKAFEENRREAQMRLENDDTVERAQDQLNMAREEIQQSRKSLKEAFKKARAKRDRAQATIASEAKVGRVTGALRRHFEARAAKLKEGLMEGEELAEFTRMVKDVRGVKRMEPPSLLKAIRDFGGVKDPRSKNVWRNGDWTSDGTRTDIEEILDDRAVSIRRNDGMELDMMREALVEAGYLPDGADINDFLDAVRKEAGGEKVYSVDDAVEVGQYEAIVQLGDELAAAGVDVSKPINQIIQALDGKARSQTATKAKSGEAARSGKKAGQAGGDGATLMRAMDRVQDANKRLDELKEIAPKVKEEQKAIRQKIAENMKSVQEAKMARSADEFYAGKDDLEIQDHVDSTIRSITGMKVGEHSIGTSLSSPTKARVLDVPDKILMPWLEKDMGVVMAQYFNSIVPDIEMARMFGADGFGIKLNEIMEEGQRLAKKATTATEKTRHLREAEERVREMRQMADRITGRFGIPDNPKEGWVRASRIARSISYMGYLGGMTISAIPDVAGVVGRNGIEAAFGPTTLLTDPKRLFKAVGDAQEMGAAAEWYLNARALSIADIADQYGSNSAFERGVGQATNAFGVATGMIPWNAGWKSVGGAFISSKMSKAAMRVKQGKATKKDMLTLSANNIEPWMATRIAEQLEKHGDMDGQLWLPQGRNWDDPDAFAAFQHAMNRELNLMVITPGQDKPIAFSTPAGAFFAQFKSFAVSAHHRVLLAGVQRWDAEVAAQVTMAIILGRFVSNLKADQHGNDRKEGPAAWEDAIDRSGLGGWLLEAQGGINAMSGGNFSISGEKTSRYKSRSEFEGALGPSIDMVKGTLFEAVPAMARGKMTDSDARKLLRPVPGNNLPYLMGIFDKIGSGVQSAFDN